MVGLERPHPKPRQPLGKQTIFCAPVSAAAELIDPRIALARLVLLGNVLRAATRNTALPDSVIPHDAIALLDLE